MHKMITATKAFRACLFGLGFHYFYNYSVIFAVTSTKEEPLRGWVDNLYGPNGIAVGAGCGVLRILQVDLAIEANFVPVDMTVNAIIASARDASQSFE